MTALLPAAPVRPGRFRSADASQQTPLGEAAGRYPDSEAYAAAALRAANWLAWLTDSARRHERLLNWAAFSLTAAFFLTHFAVVWTSSVDVPFWDEWTMLLPEGAISVGPSWKWMFSQHNEHRIACTKLLVWLQHVTVGWNVRVSEGINFGLFGCLLAGTAKLVKRWSPTTPWWVVLTFTGFMLSPLNQENHSWGFQSTFHFTLLFFLAGVYFLFDEFDRFWTAGLATACFAGSVFAMSSGVPAAAAACGVYAISACCRLARGDKDKRWKLTLRSAMLLLGMAAVFGGMFLDYDRPGHHPQLAMPWTKPFLNHFLNLISMGFGVQTMSRTVGAICLLLATTPLALICLSRRCRLETRQVAVLAACAGVLAIMASVSMGRAGFGAEQAKASRYFEYAVLLLPLAAAGWELFRAGSPVAGRIGLGAMWLAAVVGFHDNWSFGHYAHLHESRLCGLEWLQRRLVGHPSTAANEVMPAIFSVRISDFLEVAKRADVPFYRGLEPPQPPQWSELRRLEGSNASINLPAFAIGPPGKPPVVEFAGWSADDVDKDHVRQGASSFVILTGPPGEIVLPCAPLVRPDVSKHFHDRRYQHTGVWAGIAADKLPPGDYRVVLRTVRDNGDEYFEHVVFEAVPLPPPPSLP